MEKDEIIAVALLGLGVLALANPALMGLGNAQGDLEVSAQETNLDDFSFAQVAQGMPGIVYVPGLVAKRPAELSDEDRAVLEAATDGGYSLQNTTQTELEGYLRRTGFVLAGDRLLRPGVDQERGLLLYQELEQSVVVDRGNRTEAEAAALSEAVEGNETRLTENSSTLLAYDFVRDGETFYSLSTETREDGVYLSVEEVSRDDLLMSLPRVGGIDDVPEEVRDEVRTAIEGSNVTVPIDSRAALQEVALIRYEGSYYQLRAQQTDPPITDLLEPYNYALMAAGLLLIAASGLYARKVYTREKSSGGQVRHVIRTSEGESGSGSDEPDTEEPETGTEEPETDEPREDDSGGGSSGDEAEDSEAGGDDGVGRSEEDEGAGEEEDSAG